MLINLNIKTIGKIISVVLAVSLLAISLQFIPRTFAVGGADSVISFVPENGIEGSNILKVMLNPDDGDITSLRVKLDDSGTGILDFGSANIDVELPSPTWGQVWDTANNAVELYSTTSSLNGTTPIHILTVTLDNNNPANGGTISFDGNAGGTGIYPSGSPTPIVPQGVNTPYTVLPNVAPAISVSIGNGDTGVPYDTDIVVNVVDSTDNVFSRSATLHEYIDGAWSSNIRANYYTLPASGSSGFPTGTDTTLTLENTGFLNYNTQYRLVVTVSDDQGASDTKTIEFTTQVDNTPPPAQLDQKVTYMQWSEGDDDVLVRYNFDLVPDSDPGKITGVYVFDADQMTDIQNSENGLSYTDYDSAKNTMRNLVKDNNYLDYMEIAPGTNANQKIEGEIIGSAFGNAGIMRKLNFKSSMYVLVAVDEAMSDNGGVNVPDNFSDPIQLVKPGDIRGISAEDNFPNGQVTQADGVYLLRFSSTPDICPLPPTNPIHEDCN